MIFREMKRVLPAGITHPRTKVRQQQRLYCFCNCRVAPCQSVLQPWKSSRKIQSVSRMLLKVCPECLLRFFLVTVEVPR